MFEKFGRKFVGSCLEKFVGSVVGMKSSAEEILLLRLVCVKEE